MGKRKRISNKEKTKFFNPAKSRYLIITFKTMVVLLILSCLFGLGFWMFFAGTFFKIKEIDCQSQDFPCDLETVSLFNEAKDKNIFLLKTKSLAKKIEKNQPRFKRVEIVKRLPSTLLIRIFPRVGFALLESMEGRKIVVDEEGYGLNNFEEFLDLPKIRVNYIPSIGEKVSQETILKALRLTAYLQKSFISFRELNASQDSDLTLYLFKDLVATFSAQKDLSGQVDSLQYILRHSRMEDSKVQAIDLRFQKPVLKFVQ